MSKGNEDFEPYIPAERGGVREFTLRAIVVGTVLGIIFGASSLYLVLKVGLTVSASIPVAVISLTLFRLLSKVGLRDASILENNIAQTAGSAGESIAFGVGVTMPAILILGFDLELTRIMLVAVLGGLLGILMMIPLRRALIVREHGRLKYPEGTACAEVLKAGASEESRRMASPAAQASAHLAALDSGRSLGAATIFGGFGVGLVYNALMKAFKGWKDIPERVFGEPFKAASVGMEITPELLGVGYIIGPRIALIMCGGGVLAYLVLIPLIKYIGDGLETALAPGGIPIREMGPHDIQKNYILYIGAGAVAAGGIISLVRSLPTIWHGLRTGLANVRLERRGLGHTRRTDRDLSMKTVGIGIVLLLAAIGIAPGLHMNLLGALLIVVFGFLFVTVSSRLTGEIGSSSNPISGMTVATLMLTCIVFLLVGWTGGAYYVTALSIGGIVCIAASNGGTTSQDLKTGYLVGATPRLQQLAILIGAFASALCLGPILIALNEGYTVYVPVREVAPGLRTDPTGLNVRSGLRGAMSSQDAGIYRVWHKTDTEGGPAGKYLVADDGSAVWLVDPGINGVYQTMPDGSTVPKFSAPKATLMSYIIKGILDRELPWALVLAGVMIAVTLEMAGIPSLAFAVGVYLPLSASSPILAGGVVRWLVDRRDRQIKANRGMDPVELAARSDRSPGVLLASGYIAGGAIAGILIAFMAGLLTQWTSGIERWSSSHNPFYSSEAWNGGWSDLLAMIPFLGIVVLLYWIGVGGRLGRSRA